MSAEGSHLRHSGAGPTAWVARLVVVVALAVSAVVHLRLAGQYQLGQDAGIGTGNMFRISAALAVVTALFVLIRGSRISFAVAFAVSAGMLFTVVLYRYVDVPQIGPIPPMYEPIWYVEKTLSAVAEAVGAVAAAVGFVLTQRHRSAEDS